MKKVVLIFVLVFSLNASEFMCKDSFKRFEKYSELFGFALERDDVRNMKFYNNRVIHYIEKTLANCGSEWSGREEALKIRSHAISISSTLEKL